MRAQYTKHGVKLCHSNTLTGQTGGTYCTRYTEHIQDTCNNRNNTGFAQHILNICHINSKINSTMTIIKL